MDRTRRCHRLEFETYFPAESLEAFVNSKGMSNIFKSVEARKTCGIRKIDPLHRALERRGVGDGPEVPKAQPGWAARLERDAMSTQVEIQSAAGLTDGDLDTRQFSQRPTNPLHRKGYLHRLRPAPGR